MMGPLSGSTSTWRRIRPLLLVAAAALLAAGCGEDEPASLPIGGGEYIVVAWNDLGMHCLNPTYDEAVILPPYNTVWAQVIKRGNPPQIVTDGLRVEYRLVENTSSAGKTDAYGGQFAQFWTYAPDLFGVALTVDTGLNLVEPSLHNGLSGTMALRGDHFQVEGIPVVPVLDSGAWTPYQVAEIVVKDAADLILAQTRCTVPTSDEINCAACHAQGGAGTAHIGGGGASVFNNILLVHDALHGTHHVDNKPVLCASCHASPALGSSIPVEAENYLSYAIHGSHAERGAACYDCHPGATTRCNRSSRHSSSTGNCVTCHGTLADVAGSIAGGTRVPWVGEPACATCHTGVQGVATGATLYRNARGHGGVYCAGCHGSPHAMVPSDQASDNYQALQYQSKAATLGTCKVCHDTSRGGGSAGEFAEEHGGGGRASACNVCHTAVAGGQAAWPHQFSWRARN